MSLDSRGQLWNQNLHISVLPSHDKNARGLSKDWDPKYHIQIYYFSCLNICFSYLWCVSYVVVNFHWHSWLVNNKGIDLCWLPKLQSSYMIECVTWQLYYCHILWHVSCLVQVIVWNWTHILTIEMQLSVLKWWRHDSLLLWFGTVVLLVTYGLWTFNLYYIFH